MMPKIDHIGSLPGSSNGTFKGWVCSLKDEFEMMMKKMYMDSKDKEDMEGGMGGMDGDMEGMNDEMEMNPMMMAMMMLPPPMHGQNNNMMMYQQYMVHHQLMMVKKNVEKQKKEIEEQREYLEMERHNKEVLYHLGMACKNDTITSKFCLF